MKPVVRCTDTAKLLRKAAKNAENRSVRDRHGACIEIHRLNKIGEWSSEDPLAQQFRMIFNNPRASVRDVLIWQWSDADQDERILALCFMAAMVEAGDA